MKVLVVIVLAACTPNDPYDQTRSFPGPCRASAVAPGPQVGPTYDSKHDGHSEYVYIYDGHDRLVRLLGDFQGWRLYPGNMSGEYFFESRSDTRWGYDETGALSTIDIADDTDAIVETWRFNAQAITRTFPSGSCTYDPTLFSFLPTPGIDVGQPIAELGAVNCDGEITTWTIDSPTHWHSMSSSTNPTFGEDYYFDDRGHLINTTSSLDGGLEQGTTYTFDGDFLMRVTTADGFGDATYSYDQGGNLVDVTKSDPEYTQHQTYDYSCW